MTAPAPRNHPAENAHPAPTPAPVAVSDIEHYPTTPVQCCCGWREGDPIARTWVEHFRVTMNARPEPVVAPLPSEDRLRDLVSRLGFGDGVTEPMADNDTIVTWVDQRLLEAAEWRESQRWRDDCETAGHPNDEDCPEHDPAMRLMLAEAAVKELRLVPEDDEDTVRVPREAVEAFMTDYAKAPSTDEATEAAHALFLRLGGHR